MQQSETSSASLILLGSENGSNTENIKDMMVMMT